VLIRWAGAAPGGGTGGATDPNGSGDPGSNPSGGGEEGGGGGGDAEKPRKVCSGFASAPASWKVPDESYNRVNQIYGHWVTMDLDGDGKLDLVRASDPEDDARAFQGPAWRFYAAE
jgi:hypothetical protein